MNKEIEPYRKNIKVLDVKIEMNAFIGEKLTLEIIDSNRKYFRKRKIKGNYFEIEDLDRTIEELLESYIYDEKKYEIIFNRHQKMIREWKKKNVE